MRFVRTLIPAALAVALIGGVLSLSSYAAQGGDGERHHHRMSAEDRAALLDARIAALKTGLKLTADQEKNWAPLETAIRDQAKARAERMAAWRDEHEDRDERPDLIERMQERSKHMTERAEALQKFTAAAKPLYDSLDDGQKRRFAAIWRAGREHRGHEGHDG